MPKAPPKINNNEYFLNPLLLEIINKITNIIIKIKTVKKLYKLSSLNEKRPKAIPSFQIKYIFRNFDENISELLFILSK